MNSLCSPRSGRMLLSILGSLLTASAAQALPEDVPQGTLNVDRDMVRAGVNSQLDWNITYPTGITEIVEIVPPNTIVPKKNVRMKVRVLGVAFQTLSGKSNNGHGNNLDGVDSSNPGKGKGGPNGSVDASGSFDDEAKSNGKTKYQLVELPLECYVSINGSSWSNIFYGVGSSVKPNEILLDQAVTKGDSINFGARGWHNSWLPFHHTGKDDSYVTVLKNGDKAPDYAPAYNQSSVTRFLRPYINTAGEVSIGERDLIILWEASTAKPGTTYFDMQDLVVLLTFE